MFFAQRHAIAPLMCPMSPLRNHVRHIHGTIAEEEVPRIARGWIIALVKDPETIGHLFAGSNYPCDPRSRCDSAIPHTERAVAVMSARTNPGPTFITTAYLDLRPKVRDPTLSQMLKDQHGLYD